MRFSIAGTSAFAGEGVLKIGRDQDSVFMDPILVSQNADVWVMNNINAQLVRNTREATGIEPDLGGKLDHLGGRQDLQLYPA